MLFAYSIALSLRSDLNQFASWARMCIEHCCTIGTRRRYGADIGPSGKALSLRAHCRKRQDLGKSRTKYCDFQIASFARYTCCARFIQALHKALSDWVIGRLGRSRQQVLLSATLLSARCWISMPGVDLQHQLNMSLDNIMNTSRAPKYESRRPPDRRGRSNLFNMPRGVIKPRAPPPPRDDRCARVCQQALVT